MAAEQTWQKYSLKFEVINIHSFDYRLITRYGGSLLNSRCPARFVAVEKTNSNRSQRCSMYNSRSFPGREFETKSNHSRAFLFCFMEYFLKKGFLPLPKCHSNLLGKQNRFRIDCMHSIFHWRTLYPIQSRLVYCCDFYQNTCREIDTDLGNELNIALEKYAHLSFKSQFFSPLKISHIVMAGKEVFQCRLFIIRNTNS